MKLLIIATIFRYFIPFIYVGEEQFKSECSNHETYYELEVDSVGNEIEYLKLVKNDSILRIFYYKIEYRRDSSWIIPINTKIEELKSEIEKTKDKEIKKKLQKDLDWLVKRYK